MTKKLPILLLSSLLLAACGGDGEGSLSSSSSEAGESSFVPALLTPSGAPTIAFTDMGGEESWDVESQTTKIPAAFQAPGYDAIVFDGVNGLRNLVKNENEDFYLARWLTGGNFHLVSRTEESLLPGEEKTVFSFNEGALPDLVFRHLLTEELGIDLADLSIEYGNGVQDVATALRGAGSKSYDYYFIAEPALTAARNALGEENPVHEIYDLREEWEKATGSPALPQAALFLRKSAYEANEEGFSSFLKRVDKNLTLAIEDPEKAAEAMESYSEDPQEQQGRWGFNASTLREVQEDNGLGAILPGAIEDNREFVNGFLQDLEGEGAALFGESLFL